MLINANKVVTSNNIFRDRCSCANRVSHLWRIYLCSLFSLLGLLNAAEYPACSFLISSRRSPCLASSRDDNFECSGHYFCTDRERTDHITVSLDEGTRISADLDPFDILQVNARVL